MSSCHASKDSPASPSSSRAALQDIIQSITSFDAEERDALAATLDWINSGAPLYRKAQADDPLTHLVCYFSVLDPLTQKLLLVDHKKAECWLCPGGHVEIDEHPEDTVRRETFEELGITANFLQKAPFFLTITLTKGAQSPHTDVSLWYLLQLDSTQELNFDKQEFQQIHWFSPGEIPTNTHPDMFRFLQKLRAHGYLR